MVKRSRMLPVHCMTLYKPCKPEIKPRIWEARKFYTLTKESHLTERCNDMSNLLSEHAIIFVLDPILKLKFSAR